MAVARPRGVAAAVVALAALSGGALAAPAFDAGPPAKRGLRAGARRGDLPDVQRAGARRLQGAVTENALVARTTWNKCACKSAWTWQGIGSCNTSCCNLDGDVNGPWCVVEDPSCEDGLTYGYCRPARIARTSACQDAPLGWADSEGASCGDYSSDKWCTFYGGYGTGWKADWGAFKTYEQGSRTAVQACCNCGGGSKGREGCMDEPGWKDSDGDGCSAYEDAAWCTNDGQTGAGWNKNWGTIPAFQKDGRSAFDACCACGSGAKGNASAGAPAPTIQALTPAVSVVPAPAPTTPAPATPAAQTPVPVVPAPAPVTPAPESPAAAAPAAPIVPAPAPTPATQSPQDPAPTIQAPTPAVSVVPAPAPMTPAPATPVAQTPEPVVPAPAPMTPAPESPAAAAPAAPIALAPAPMPATQSPQASPAADPPAESVVPAPAPMTPAPVSPVQTPEPVAPAPAPMLPSPVSTIQTPAAPVVPVRENTTTATMSLMPRVTLNGCKCKKEWFTSTESCTSYCCQFANAPKPWCKVEDELCEEAPWGVCREPVQAASGDHCVTSPAGWTDKQGKACSAYKQNNYCTSDGKKGSGWLEQFGAIDLPQDAAGFSALEACCECGGGYRTLLPSVRATCRDEADWTDVDGDGCQEYAANSWCTGSGQPGSGWHEEWGTLAAHARKGEKSAFEACCICGGGGDSASGEGAHALPTTTSAQDKFDLRYTWNGCLCKRSWTDPKTTMEDNKPVSCEKSCCEGKFGTWWCMVEDETCEEDTHGNCVPQEEQEKRPTCSNDPLGWEDSEGDNCMTYEAGRFCTPSGEHGEGWQKDWGTFADYKGREGKTARDVCCQCGGGSDTAQENLHAGCTDVENWEDPEFFDCAQYQDRSWCREDGSPGWGWHEEWGNFDGNPPASQACCACGGGKRSEKTAARGPDSREGASAWATSPAAAWEASTAASSAGQGASAWATSPAASWEAKPYPGASPGAGAGIAATSLAASPAASWDASTAASSTASSTQKDAEGLGAGQGRRRKYDTQEDW